MKGFIQVNRIFGDKTFLKSVNILHIIDFENMYISTSRVLSCGHTQTSYTETINVKETYEEIKELIEKSYKL